MFYRSVVIAALNWVLLCKVLANIKKKRDLSDQSQGGNERKK